MPSPKYLFPKPGSNKSPRMDNLAATPAAQKVEAQKMLSPLMEVFSLLGGAPLKAAASALTYSPESEAAFISPRSATAKVTKFLDAPSGLEHLPNPPETDLAKLLEDVDRTTIGALYSKFPEGREILKSVPKLGDIPVHFDEVLPPNIRGRAYRGANPKIAVNAFPEVGEYRPGQVIFHEIQHVIDDLQGRVSGTNLLSVKPHMSDVKAADLQRKMTPDSTIDQEEATKIMSLTDRGLYKRHTGENRARMDAKQDDIYDITETWHYDSASETVVTGK